MAEIPSIPIGILGVWLGGGNPFLPLSGLPGANNPLPRGEQSDPRTAENAPQNQSFIQFIGRKRVYPLSPLLGGGFPKEGGDACSTVNSFRIGGGCAACAGVSRRSKMLIETFVYKRFGRSPAIYGGGQFVASGRTIRPQDCGKRAPKPINYSNYRAQEVYPLSPLLRGGFQRRGGVL